MLEYRKINDGFLLQKANTRVQFHVYKHSPIKGRGYDRVNESNRLNVSHFYIIYNPIHWDALSTWKGTPFRIQIGK